MSSEVLPTTKKRKKTETEGKSSSLETNSSQSELVDELTHTTDKLTDTINSFATGDSCWDAIKEIPHLDNRSRFEALTILNTRAKKIEFLKMTPEE